MNDAVSQLGLLDDEEIVLDDAALTLALLDHPETDLEPYGELLDSIALRVADEDIGGPDIDRAALLARVIGDEFGFVGDRETYDHPDNADLIRVIDRSRGLPVSLSIIYVAAARRVGWSAYALDVPGHVLVLIGDRDSEAPVIIDPFRGGVVVSPEELAMLLASQPRDPALGALQVATMRNRAVLVRLLLNQATRAEAAANKARALILYERITAFAPEYGPAWWERARLELAAGQVPAARASLCAMLETTRDEQLRQKVTSTLLALAT